jgi:diguanylate cyclase (GGDEF)-like protein
MAAKLQHRLAMTPVPRFAAVPRGEVDGAPLAVRHGGLNVLVVEDEDVSRRGLEQAVKLLGYQCRSAKDGLEAWQMHESDPADVILSDWKLPRMDGLELCRRLRDTEREGAYTYFIFLTSYGDKEHLLLGMQAGADDYHSKPVDIDELQARLVSAQRVIGLHRRLAEKTLSLRRDSQTSFAVARRDALTGIANRLRMDEDLTTLWSQAARYARPICLAICDIDRFKKYNDHFGHLAGDEVLRRIAQALRDGLRQADGVYRYGGEEFLAVLPEQGLAEAARAMDRVRKKVESFAIPTVGKPGFVTISVGVAQLDVRRDDSLAEWLGRADAALYGAKNSGRNRVEPAPPSNARER